MTNILLTLVAITLLSGCDSRSTTQAVMTVQEIEAKSTERLLEIRRDAEKERLCRISCKEVGEEFVSSTYACVCKARWQKWISECKSGCSGKMASLTDTKCECIGAPREKVKREIINSDEPPAVQGMRWAN